MKTYAIIDDEPIAHRIIEGYCKDLPYLTKVGNCYSAFEAIQLLNGQQVDLLFLDLNLPRLSGFEFLRTLTDPPKVIVTTAYKEFALEGYELNISDYLLKPFSFERFLKAVNSVMKEPSAKAPSAEPIPATKDSSSLRFFLKGDKKHHQVNSEDILFIEAYGNYVKVQLREGFIVSHEKISALEELLPSGNFLRVHKSYIVALDKISYIEGNRIAIADHRISIGQTYRKLLNRFL